MTETAAARRRRRFAATQDVVTGLIAAVLVLALAVILTLTISNHNQGHANHVLLSTITKQNEEIRTLLNEHTAPLKAQRVYDADATALAKEIIANQLAICATVHADCPPFPALPNP
jgi:hypothetical protein